MKINSVFYFVKNFKFYLLESGGLTCSNSPGGGGTAGFFWSGFFGTRIKIVSSASIRYGVVWYCMVKYETGRTSIVWHGIMVCYGGMVLWYMLWFYVMIGIVMDV